MMKHFESENNYLESDVKDVTYAAIVYCIIKHNHIIEYIYK